MRLFSCNNGGIIGNKCHRFTEDSELKLSIVAFWLVFICDGLTARAPCFHALLFIYLFNFLFAVIDFVK